jgi:hypothetical protein
MQHCPPPLSLPSFINNNRYVQVHGQECGRGFRYCQFLETDGMFSPLHADFDPSVSPEALVSYYVAPTVHTICAFGLYLPSTLYFCRTLPLAFSTVISLPYYDTCFPPSPLHVIDDPLSPTIPFSTVRDDSVGKHTVLHPRSCRHPANISSHL